MIENFVLKTFIIFVMFLILQKILRTILKDTVENSKLRKDKFFITSLLSVCFFLCLILSSAHKISNNEVLVTGGIINKEIRKVAVDPGFYFTMPLTPTETYILNKEMKIEFVNTVRDKRKIFTKDMKKFYIDDGYISYKVRDLDVLIGLIHIFDFDIQDGLYNHLFNTLKNKTTTFDSKEFSDSKLSGTVVEDFYRFLEGKLEIKNIKKCLEINIFISTSKSP